MANDQRDKSKIQKKIEVNVDDFEWYIRTHNIEGSTDKTGFSLLMRMLLASYREVCSNPNDYILLGVDMKALTQTAARDVKDKEET